MKLGSQKMKLRTILLMLFFTFNCIKASPPQIRYQQFKTRVSINQGLTRIKRTATNAPDTFTTNLSPGFMGAGDSLKVTGQTFKTLNGKDVYGFIGIQYGDDPSGVNRFKRVNVYKLANETKELKASEYGKKCPQMTGQVFDKESSENCLSINVYTNKKPDGTTSGTLPVMVFIHGGTFVSGDSSTYGPDVFLDYDVILVTFNYRIGLLGFFTQLLKDAPGNTGLWDQVVALQWVQQNIGFLGGDRNKVTIFGEGTGATSVNLHLLFKDIKGVESPLFQAAILESGSAIDHWALDDDPTVSVKKVAAAVGCNDTKSILACMHNKTTEELVFGLDSFTTTERTQGRIGYRGVSPVVQRGYSVPSKDVLLTDKPGTLMQNVTNINDVPVIIGVNKHEGSFTFGIIYWSLLTGKYDDKEYLRNEMIADILESIGAPEPAYSFAELVQDDYIGDHDLANLTAASPGLIDLTGNLYIKNNAWRTAEVLTSLEGKVNSTYFYSFEFESNNSLFDVYFPDKTPEQTFKHGVCHGDELMYLFNIPDGIELDGREKQTRDRLATLWTNFATHLDPTPDEKKNSWVDLNIPKWKPLEPTVSNYLLLEDECKMAADYSQRRHVALEEETPEPSPKPTGSTSSTKSTSSIAPTATTRTQSSTPEVTTITAGTTPTSTIETTPYESPTTTTSQPRTSQSITTTQPISSQPTITATITYSSFPSPITASSVEPGPFPPDCSIVNQQRIIFMSCMIISFFLMVGFASLSAFFYYKYKRGDRRRNSSS